MSGEAFLPSEGGALRQGEILSDITVYDYDPATKDVQPQPKPFSILINQDCDLIQDFDRRESGKPGNLDYALLAEGMPWAVVKPTLNGRDIWKPISQNKNERFQLLSPVPADRDANGEGFPSLVIDFRSFFAVPVSELYRQLAENEAQRRSRLSDIYRENFQLRMSNFLSRIPLPEPHVPD